MGLYMGENVYDLRSGIPTAGGDPIISPLSVSENGTYNTPSGVDGFNPVVVAVPEWTGDIV